MNYIGYMLYLGGIAMLQNLSVAAAESVAR